MVIYADVLIGVNIIVTYILLVSVRLATGFATNKAGVGFASLLGGVSSLVVLLGERGVLFALFYRLFTAIAIVLLGFLPRKIKGFLKLLLYFLGITFLCGGLLFFVIAVFSPSNVMLINGTPYFNMSVKLLIGAVLVVYGSFMVLDYFFLRNISKSNLYPVAIELRGVSVHLNGFLDTGNNLKDGFNQRPVFVAELQSIAPLLSCAEIDFFSGGVGCNPPDSLKQYYRLVPCKTVSGGGVMSGFVADTVTVRGGGGVAQAEGVTVAVSKENLADGEYGVLLNKSIFDMNWKGNSGACKIKK